jgi:hypothetical protein
VCSSIAAAIPNEGFTFKTAIRDATVQPLVWSHALCPARPANAHDDLNASAAARVFKLIWLHSLPAAAALPAALRVAARSCNQAPPDPSKSAPNQWLTAHAVAVTECMTLMWHAWCSDQTHAASHEKLPSTMGAT